MLTHDDVIAFIYALHHLDIPEMMREKFIDHSHSVNDIAESDFG